MNSRQLLPSLAALFIASLSAESAPCVDGESGGFACSHVEFAGHLSPAQMNGDGEVLNDIWGWADAGGEEYAIVGMQDGTAFVRLGVDGKPEFLGRLKASDGEAGIAKSGGHVHGRKRCHDDLCGEEDSAWRDVKVYANYAYIVSEAVGHGLQIFDLTTLRTLTGAAPDNDLPRAGYYDGIGHAHNLHINEGSGRAYIVGHDREGVAGGLHVLDLSDPVNPEKLAELDGDGYTHDVQCVDYKGPDPDVRDAELCFASNEDTLTIWNVTDPANARIVSRTGYSDASYTHQGWLSEDQRWFFLNDELDEQGTGSRTHLRVFNVSDVEAPELVADYFAPTLAIDHNNYTHGRWLYQSNYAAGLRILDVSDPRNPVEAAYFDPQPTDEANFYGTWSNFAFPSGFVAFTDIRDGLYVVRPTLNEATVVDLAIGITVAASSAAIGETVEGEIVVSNIGDVEATNVLLTMHLPANWMFNEVVDPTGWTCEADGSARVVECRSNTLAVGSDTRLPFSVPVEISGTIDLIAMVYAGEVDAAPADNLAVATFAGSARASDSGGGAIGWLLLPLAGLRRRPRRR